MEKLQPLSLDSYFDRIFYINLEKDRTRNMNMLAQFEKYGIKNFERIVATELKTLPSPIFYRNFIKNDFKYILGGLSCRESHLQCIQFAKERNYKQILILEDDVIFLTDPNLLLSLNKTTLNHWNLLYFGGLTEPQFRNQIVCAHAYAVNHSLYDDILNMALSSGMEIDNFYAKIIQHMSYNYNQSGKYNVKMIYPFNQIVQDKAHSSNIQAY